MTTGHLGLTITGNIKFNPEVWAFLRSLACPFDVKVQHDCFAPEGIVLQDVTFIEEGGEPVVLVSEEQMAQLKAAGFLAEGAE